MPIDHSRALRRAIVARLVGESAVAAMVGNRVYGMRAPASANQVWPFIRYGNGLATPFEATCWNGSEHRVTLHAFAKGPDEDEVQNLAAAVVAAFAGDELPLEGGLGLVGMDWRSTQIIPDGAEPGAFHAIMQFDVITTE